MLLSWKQFAGAMPRLPAHRLDPGYAQIARNVDLTNGDLRPYRALFPIATMANVVRSMYTNDGIRFFTWSEDVDAVRGPVIDDSFKRIYYTSPAGMFVTFDDQLKVNGGPPVSFYRAGVPAPVGKPGLAVSAYDPGATFTVTFFYEASGVKYQEQSVVPVMLEPGRKFSFMPPGKNVFVPPADSTGSEGDAAANASQTPAGFTPDNAFPAVHVVATLPSEDDRLLFDVYSVGSSFNVLQPTAKVSLSDDPSDATKMLMRVDFDTGTLQEDRAYVYTYVNSLGEESAPSEPALTTVNIFESVTVALAPQSAVGFAPVSNYRVYRTSTGANGQTDYFKVGDGSVADGTIYLDTKKSSELSTDILQTWDWEPPPAGLNGLFYIGNGMLAGFSGTDFMVCEPFRPHAWPKKYAIPLLNRPIRGMVNGNTVLVTTTAYPYVITGTTPDGLVQQRLPAAQPAVSKRAHADLGNAIAYATNDGIVLVAGGSTNLEPALKLWGRKMWRAAYGSALSAMQFAVHDGQLVASVFGRNGFIVRFDETAGLLTEQTFGSFDGMFMLPETDSLYVSIGQTVYSFSGSLTEASFVWRSGEVTLPKPMNLGALQLLVSAPVTARVFADGVKVGTDFAFNSTRIERLPTDVIARRWSIEVEGAGAVEEIHLADTVMELRRA